MYLVTIFSNNHNVILMSTLKINRNHFTKRISANHYRLDIMFQRLWSETNICCMYVLYVCIVRMRMQYIVPYIYFGNIYKIGMKYTT
jgi:hypothetical protein